MNKQTNKTLRGSSEFSENRKNCRLKWLSHYEPTVDLNDPQYHIIAEPQDSKYQKISVRNLENARPITTFLEIEDKNELRKVHLNFNQEDHSKIKEFTFVNHTQNQADEILLNGEETVRGSEWARKYEPKAFYELLTDELHNRNMLTWLKSWDGVVFGREAPIITAPTKTLVKPFPANNQNNNNQPNNNRSNYSYQNQPEYNRSRLILLSGPPGCGKTTLARTVARHCGYEIVELNASDDRTGKVLIEKIESLGKNNSVLNNKPTLIVIDEVDGALEQDGNGIKEVLNYIQSGNKSTGEKNVQKKPLPKPNDLPKNEPVNHLEKHPFIPRPIIFICNDPFAKGLRDLRSNAIVMYFRQVDKERIVKRLKEITEKEKVYVENDVLNKIAELCNCDIRSSLSVLEYVCKYQRSSGLNPKEYLSSIMNEPKRSELKQIINLREFSYNFSKNENPSLLLQGLFHNFIQYKQFFSRKISQSLHVYDMLSWSDVLLQQSFKYQNETDHYLMKLNKEIVHQLVGSWPTFLQSTVSLSSVIKDYLYVLYYAVQTSSLKDTDVFDCVGKMITYGIELASRNSPYLFKPEFDSLLTYGSNKLEILYSNMSRTYIEESYAFAKLKSNLIGDLSLADVNKNTEELLSQLNIKSRRRKRNCESVTRHSIKYQFIEGSGTQITYDLKFSYFFV